MVWFTKTEAQKHSRVVIALESLSSDVLSAQLRGLEAELLAAGFLVQRLEFPSSSAKDNLPGLTEDQSLLKSSRALGIIASIDRARTFANFADETTKASEVVLLTGSILSTAAWLATLEPEHGERVALYRWLDELEHAVFLQKRIDLVVLLDCLPEHIDVQDSVILPVGWGQRGVPEAAALRASYIEAAKLYPGSKIISCHRDGLLKPDSEIENELWNLVRRIALKTNLPPKRV
jgi:hypothetical protein